MATTRGKKDITAEIMERILSTPVPQAGLLTHPAMQKEPRKTKQVNLGDLKSKSSSAPEDISAWTAKTFVDEFAIKYMAATGGNYKKLYKADSPTFSTIQKFFASNGLDANTWTKKMLDWAFEHREEIALRSSNLFTPQEIVRELNRFYQQVVLPGVEQGSVERDTADISLLEEINQADAVAKTTHIFATFGIPVTMTFLVEQRGVPLDDLVVAVRTRFADLQAGRINGTARDRELLKDIFWRSVIGSPYPCDFSGLNWRSLFASEVMPYRTESWWRDDDYAGKPLNKYSALMRIK